MSDPLPTTLVVVLIVLSIGMLATLLQIRKTARKFEAFLEATQKDLADVTADVHAFRLHVERLVVPLQTTTQELGEFSRVLGEIAQGFRNVQMRVQTALATAGSYVNGLSKGVTTLLPFVRR